MNSEVEFKYVLEILGSTKPADNERVMDAIYTILNEWDDFWRVESVTINFQNGRNTIIQLPEEEE